MVWLSARASSAEMPGISSRVAAWLTRPGAVGGADCCHGEAHRALAGAWQSGRDCPERPGAPGRQGQRGAHRAEDAGGTLG